MKQRTIPELFSKCSKTPNPPANHSLQQDKLQTQPQPQRQVKTEAQWENMSCTDLTGNHTDISSDEENVFQNAICRKRILRESDHCPQDMQDTCHASSKSSGTRFRKRVATKRKASWDVSMCDTELFNQFVSLQSETGNDSSVNNELQRTLMSELLKCKSVVEKMKDIPNETLQPDVWTMAMMNENGYEPREIGHIVLRPCSRDSECLSRYIKKECDCDQDDDKTLLLAECINADAVKKIVLEKTNEIKSNVQQFGQHQCLLCRTYSALAMCMNPLNQNVVSLLDYLQFFSYNFVDVHSDYTMMCQLVLKETGVHLTYRSLNVPSFLQTLSWVHNKDDDNGDIVHRIDFSHLAHPMKVSEIV